MEQRRTRNPLVWLSYGCWIAANWMDRHEPYWPLWLRMRFLEHYGNTLRFGATRRDHAYWRAHLPPERWPTYKPIPWIVGDHGMGPWVHWWNKATRFVRKGTGGRSHRCEFTDREMGALYGHKHGAFMDAYFDEFLRRIER